MRHARALAPLFAVVTVSGCAVRNPTTVVPAETIARGIDFRRFSDQGFLITPEAYTGDYDSRGLVSVTLYPLAHRDVKAVRADIEGYRSTRPAFGGWQFTPVAPAVALDSAYALAVSMGADALVRFEMKRVDRQYGPEAGGLLLPGVEVSGFAIKRR